MKFYRYSRNTIKSNQSWSQKVYATTTHQLMRKLVYSKTRNNFWRQKNRFWHWPSMLKSPLKGVHPKEIFSLLLPVFIYKHWTVVAVAHISVSYLINTVKFCSKVGIIMIIIMLWFDWFQSPSNLYSLFMSCTPQPASSTEDAKWRHNWMRHIPKSAKLHYHHFFFVIVLSPYTWSETNFFLKRRDYWIKILFS